MRYLTSFIAILLFSPILWAQFPEFRYYEIGHTDQMFLGQSSLIDLDGDKDLDLILGASGSTIWWFEYKDADQWEMHFLGDDALTDRGGTTMDVDGDGLEDQISGGSWYKNPGSKHDTWERFENGGIYAYDNLSCDFDNDGVEELVSLSLQDGLYVYFVGDKPDKKWKKIKLDDGVPGGISPNGLGDIDLDGDMDIVRSDTWYENVDGTGKKWKEHRTLAYVDYLGAFARSARIFVADMDEDGDMDVVMCEANNPESRLVWQENKDSKGLNWYMHPIATETEQDMHSLCVADFDNDGDLDVFTGGGPMTSELYKRSFIYENVEGTGVKWEAHEILFKTENTDAVAADVDGDGDIDICGKTWKDDTVYYLRNMLMENR
ncbi:MAG: VCBS repeat-containing protein [Bacteroidales bacterium]|nr:VCBS repeat-containing protein [Bacteroidales bacterium]